MSEDRGTVRFEITMPAELAARVEVFCGRQAVRPSRSAAVRWLIKRGLASLKKEVRADERDRG